MTDLIEVLEEVVALVVMAVYMTKTAMKKVTRTVYR